MNLMSVTLLIVLTMVIIVGSVHEQNPDKKTGEIVDSVIVQVDSNIEQSFSSFKDLNIGDTDDSNNFGGVAYHVATGFKHSVYAMTYLGALVSEHMPWVYQNSVLIIVVIFLFILSPIISIVAIILLGLFLWLKERWFPKKFKVNGVWKNE